MRGAVTLANVRFSRVRCPPPLTPHPSPPAKPGRGGRDIVSTTAGGVETKQNAPSLWVSLIGRPCLKPPSPIPAPAKPKVEICWPVMIREIPLAIADSNLRLRFAGKLPARIPECCGDRRSRRSANLPARRSRVRRRLAAPCRLHFDVTGDRGQVAPRRLRTSAARHHGPTSQPSASPRRSGATGWPVRWVAAAAELAAPARDSSPSTRSCRSIGSACRSAITFTTSAPSSRPHSRDFSVRQRQSPSMRPGSGSAADSRRAIGVSVRHMATMFSAASCNVSPDLEFFRASQCASPLAASR